MRTGSLRTMSHSNKAGHTIRSKHALSTHVSFYSNSLGGNEENTEILVWDQRLWNYVEESFQKAYVMQIEEGALPIGKSQTDKVF